MRGRGLVAAAIIAGLLAMDTSTTAGGWSWFGPQENYHAVGDQLSIRATFWFSGEEDPTSAGPYYLYLVPRYRWFSKGPVPAYAIHLGFIDIEPGSRSIPIGPGSQSDAWVASAEFVLPDVPSGLYSLDYCNDPCTIDSVGDLGGGSFWVGDTVEEARALARLDRLESKKLATLRDTKRELRKVQATLAVAEEERANLVNLLRVAALKRESAPESEAVPSRRSVPVWGLVVSLVVVLLGVWYRRRLRRHEVPDMVPDQLVREVRDSQVPSRQPMTSVGRPVMSMPAPPLTKS